MRTRLLALAAALAGCSPLAPVPDASRYYTLDPTPPSAIAPRAGAGTVGLRPVALPPYLDRPQVVTRAGPERIEVAPLDRWAAPLDTLFVRALAEGLRGAPSVQEVVLWPWAAGAGVDWSVSVDVLRFEREPDGAALLDARWLVAPTTGAAPVRGHTRARVAASDASITASVSALSRAVRQLADEIGAAVPPLAAAR